MGLAYAEAFARRGARLALADIDATGLAKAADRFAGLLGAANVHAQRVDVAEWEEVVGFAASVKEKLGNAHVVLNNAGIGGYGQPFFHTPLAELEQTMSVNFNGVVYGTKAFLPQLIANGEGVLVNVSSIFGLIGPPNATDYAASKFAVRGFTEALMAEFYNSPIQIHCLHPGGVRTNISSRNRNERFDAEKLITPPEEVAEYVIKCIAAKRLKIVYGYESRRVWLGSNILPLRLLIKQFWREAHHIVDTARYADFNPFLNGKR